MAEQNGSGMDLGLEDDYGGFFTDLENTKPFMKVALEGFAASGKTWTMVQLAIRLWKRLNSTKPIVYVDSEKAGQFLIPHFKAAGIKVLHRETKSFADLMQAMKLMREQKVADIILVDSITHYYENYIQSYLAKVKRTKLQFEDWGIIKPTWKREFSEPLVADPYHMFFTGRAGYEYDNEVNKDTGKREIFKSGVKMKVEGETAYEPDILILMERFEKVLGEHKEVWREATVIKDRSGLIDGKQFKNPTGEEFMPAIEFCLSNAVTRPKVVEAETGHIFATEEDKREWVKKRDILVEEIESDLVEAWPGQSADDKQAKIVALKNAFGTASWTWIKSQRPELLADGKARIKEHIVACKQMQRDAIAAQGPKKASPAPAPSTVTDTAAAPPPAATVETPASAAEPTAEEKPARKKKTITVLVEGTPEQPPVTPPPPPDLKDVQAG